MERPGGPKSAGSASKSQDAFNATLGTKNESSTEAKRTGEDVDVASLAGLLISPKMYAEQNQLQRKFSDWVLDFCQALFQREPDETQQFLDIGSGTGDFTRDGLLPRCMPCRRIVGVDSSAGMVENAKRAYSDDELEFKVADIGHDEDVTALLSEYGHFDRVYSFHTLHWPRDQAAALKNVARLLKPSGECLLVFHAALLPVEAVRSLVRKDRWNAFEHVLKGVDITTQDMSDSERKSYMYGLLGQAGLTPSMLELPRCTLFDGCSAETLVGLCATLAADVLVSALSLDVIPELLHDLLEEMRKVNSPDADRCRYRVYVIKASKVGK